MIKSISQHTAAITSICYSSSSCVLITGSEDKTIKSLILDNSKPNKSLSISSEIKNSKNKSQGLISVAVGTDL